MIDAKLLMTKARTKLLLDHPFFGHLVMSMRLIEAVNVGTTFNTAATDGKNIWYNPEFIEKIYTEDPVYVQSLLGHEVLHAVFSHVGRRGYRHPLLWNIACDFVVNSALVESGLKIHPNWLYDVKYKDWTTEAVYDDLLKDAEAARKAQGKGTVDSHYGDDDFPGEGMTEDEKEAREKDMKERVVKAANCAGAGNIPGSIKRMIEEFTNPKIKWNQLLRKYISEYTKADYTWMRPNKRHFSSGIMLPSMDKQQRIKLAVAVDTSGSISNDDINAFMGEINNIVSMFDEYEIDAAYFDTLVHSPTKIKGSTDFKDFCENVKGGGGTTFEVWWEWFHALQDASKVNAIIFFTDGYPSGEWIPEYMPYSNIFWVVKGSNNVAPVGVTLHYNDE